MKNNILLSVSHLTKPINLTFKRCFIVFIFLSLLTSRLDLKAQCSNPPAYNDPGCGVFFPNNAFNVMNIPCAWTVTNGDPNVVVAVFDRYFDVDHRDLAGKIEKMHYSDDCNPNEDPTVTHGTASMGAIAAIRNNGECVAGAGGDIKVAGFAELPVMKGY
ncbi:MAG: hypothetical protein IPP37_15560 [Saprospiraceae bacterium]|nr:hypothetical protein [Saprospiraceae bacterium]